jgi:hypothetical protein
MAVETLSLRLDADQATADLELLARAANRSLQVRQRLLHLCELGGELAGVHLEFLPATDASQCRVRLDLPDGFAALARAVRAGDFDAL